MRERNFTTPTTTPATWLTTGDAAKMLHVTRQGVRWLVEDDQLHCEWTHAGQRIFRQGEVLRLVATRATARIARRDERLAAVRVRMLRVDVDEPRQLALDFRAHLRLVGARGKGRAIA